ARSMPRFACVFHCRTITMSRKGTQVQPKSGIAAYSTLAILYTVIDQDLMTNLQVQMNTFETDQVNNPFAAAGALAGNWVDNREQLLKMTGTIASPGAAAAAARNLRASFESLVNNRFDRAALDSLLSDINAMLDIATKIAEGK